MDRVAEEYRHGDGAGNLTTSFFGIPTRMIYCPLPKGYFSTSKGNGKTTDGEVDSRLKRNERIRTETGARNKQVDEDNLWRYIWEGVITESRGDLLKSIKNHLQYGEAYGIVKGLILSYFIKQDLEEGRLGNNFNSLVERTRILDRLSDLVMFESIDMETTRKHILRDAINSFFSGKLKRT